MILTEIRELIDLVFENNDDEYAYIFCKGYIAGVKQAPYYGKLADSDWCKLNNYIMEKIEESFQQKLSIISQPNENLES